LDLADGRAHDILCFFFERERTTSLFMCRIFLYLICHDFRKINGRIKIFDKCIFGVVAHCIWRTTLGETPTVGSTGRWGQAPADVATGGRSPSVVAHGGRIPSVVAHGGRSQPI
jgi:hypothetical protein